jgi:hypothetical protein
MKINLKIIGIVIAFGLVSTLIVVGTASLRNRKQAFQAENNKIAGYVDTTKERVARAVITIPDKDTITQLENNVGSYILEGETGENIAVAQSTYMVTAFLPGIYMKKSPRLDVIVPVYIHSDDNESMYIFLFNDRGDALIEKSYARLGRGDIDVEIEEVTILPEEAREQDQDVEYKVRVVYIFKSRSAKSETRKEVIIPVIDGHFDPEGTISK